MGARRMGHVLVFVVMGGVVAAGCGRDHVAGSPVGGPAAQETTATTSVAPSPTSVPVVESSEPAGVDADPLDAARRLGEEQWSTAEIWGDGWVRLSAEVEGVADGPLAPDEIPTGPTTQVFAAATTVDGSSWEELPIGLPQAGGLRAAASTGSSVVVVMAHRDDTDLTVATTVDLVDWRVAGLALPRPVGNTQVSASPVDGRWLIATVPDERGGPGEVWLVGGERAERVTSPGGDCCRFEDTDAGIVAAGFDDAVDETAQLWYSADGRTWMPRAGPSTGTVIGLASVDGGVLMSVRDEVGDVSSWRGAPDAQGWTPVVLPEQVVPPVVFGGEDHRGVVEVVTPPIPDRVGAGSTLPPHVFDVDVGGLHFTFDWADVITVTVTDPASGAPVYERSGTLTSSGLPEYIELVDDELRMRADDGTVAHVVPYDVASAASQAARAGGESPPTVDRAPDRPLVVFSVDGLEWSIRVVGEWQEGSVPVGPLNGSRVLLAGPAGETFRVDLAG